MKSAFKMALLLPLLTVSPVGLSTAFAQDTTAQTDPRANDPAYQRSQRLFGSIRDVLEDAAQARTDAREDPGVGTILSRPFGLDAESRANDLLADAFSVVSDAPVTKIQEEIAERRSTITELKDRVSRLREDRISAPVARHSQ